VSDPTFQKERDISQIEGVSLNIEQIALAANTAADPEQHSLQFSIRTLLIISFCLAISFALLFSIPNYIAVAAIITLNIALPASLTTGAVYTRNTWRAFCIGGLFPSGLVLYVTGWMLSLSLFDGPGTIRNLANWVEFSDAIAGQYKVYSGCSWVMTVLIGSTAVLIRYIVQKQTKSAESTAQHL
jgi:hypothetical protein